MTIMVTGANGFLGKQIYQLLIGSNAPTIPVYRQDCDLSSSEQTALFFSELNPTLIIHCAAFVPVSDAEYNDSVLSSKNTLMLDNILKASTCPIIYISSMTIYGPSENVSRSETTEPNPQSIYGDSKYQCEQILKISKRNSLAVRLPGLFGSERASGIVYNNLDRLCKGLGPQLPNKPLLWAAMDVLDAAKSIVDLSLSFSKTGFNIINLGYDDEYSINYLIRLFERLFQVEIDNHVLHPVFKFDLKRINEEKAAPDSNLEVAVTKLKDSLC